MGLGFGELMWDRMGLDVFRPGGTLHSARNAYVERDIGWWVS